MQVNIARDISYHAQQVAYHSKKIDQLTKGIPKTTEPELLRQLENLERVRKEKLQRFNREASEVVREHMRKDISVIDEAMLDVETKLMEVRG